MRGLTIIGVGGVMLSSIADFALGGVVPIDPSPFGMKTAPPAAPIVQRKVESELSTLSSSLNTPPAGLTQYSIGDPTDLEQAYLEYINRARRDPSAEAVRLRETTDPDLLANYDFHTVDLDLMVQQISALPAAPPLSFSAQLITAARKHSADMLENAFQGHDGTDGSTFATRATDQGYDWSSISENVFAHARSVEHGHAGFEVDWGGDGDPASGGMQNPPGHRLNIHNADIREVGIGVVEGTNGDFGPQSVTQDLGTRPGLTPFVTGVVFYDLNANDFYDPGEGVGGVMVLAEDSSFYAVTASSGGYSVPVPAGGNDRVTFQVPGVPDVQVATSVADESVKVDHVMTYQPPTISGPENPSVNGANLFTFTPVGGATGYQWQQVKRDPAPAIEGAENGLNNVLTDTTSSYSVLDNVVRASGSSSFHLAHPRSGDTNSPPVDQFLVLDRVFQAGPATELTFASRLGWATPDQVARAQVSIDDGATWEDVWSQPGTGNAGELSFTTQSVSLTSFEGREFNVRFVFDFTGGSFFSETDPGVGFYIDEIAVTGADELIDSMISNTESGSAFTFSPTAEGPYALSVRPRIGDRFLPFGPAMLVDAQVGSATSLRVTSVERLADGRLQLHVAVANAGAGALKVEGARDVTGPWIEEAATIESAGSPDTFRAIVPAGLESRRFYRVASD